MRNPHLSGLDPLLGHWTLRLSNAWFLEPAGGELHGRASIEWLGDAFVVLRSELDGRPMHDIVMGHDDARNAFAALYHDERGVCRLFQMTFGQGRWTMVREDPDFYQRFRAEVGQEAIQGRWEASQDGGRTWRKDFDLGFSRTPS